MIESIIAVAVTAALGFFTVKADKIVKALKDLSEVLNVIVDALGDDKLSKKEIEDIKKQGKELIGSVKGILK